MFAAVYTFENNVGLFQKNLFRFHFFQRGEGISGLEHVRFPLGGAGGGEGVRAGGLAVCLVEFGRFGGAFSFPETASFPGGTSGVGFENFESAAGEAGGALGVEGETEGGDR